MTGSTLLSYGSLWRRPAFPTNLRLKPLTLPRDSYPTEFGLSKSQSVSLLGEFILPRLSQTMTERACCGVRLTPHAGTLNVDPMPEL